MSAAASDLHEIDGFVAAALLAVIALKTALSPIELRIETKA